MKTTFTFLFILLTVAATASTNVTMTFGYFDCYTGHKVQPTSISAQKFSTTGQVETNIAVSPTDKYTSLPIGKYLLTISCIGYRQQIANLIVGEDNATVYEFFLSPLTKDYRTETEYVQSKVQSGKMFLNGFVVDENGLPITNTTLTILNKQENATTNAEGYFEIMFPLQGDEEYINFEISKNGFTKNVYNNVLCWNKGDWTYQVKLRQGNNNTANVIESTTAATHIETPEQLLQSLPNLVNGSQPQALTSGSCVPNSINVAFSSTGTNCCPGGGGGFPSCQTVQNYIVDVYIEHVIPNEWLGSWNALPNMIEAFKAGAVAIRSYSVNRINHPIYSSWYDICSSPCCQNFGATNSITSAGVTQTTDYVLYYNSDVALSEYSAENNHLLPQCSSSSLGIFCTDGQFSLLGVCYSDPVSTGKRINGHGRGMSQRGSARWASGKSLNSCSNSTSGLPNTGLATKNWTQILNQYYPPYTVYHCGNTCPQPSNDLCGNATILTPVATCTYTDGTTCGATPINPTTGMPTCVLSPSTAADVWYKFVATNTNATISVQSAANFDAVVQVLQNVTCASSYTQMQCVNNTGAGGLETISLTGLTVSNTYWIRIVCNTGSTGTDFQVCVTSTATQNCPDPYEPNDAIASAYNLFPPGLGSSSASTSVNGFITTGADQDWFLLNISTYGTLNINLTNLPANYDLALYTGSGQLLASSINTGTTSENIPYSYTSSSGVTPPFYIKVYPNNSSQYSVCSSYNLSVSWTPSSTCITPNAPTPNAGTASCPGTGYTSSTLYLGYNINGASNYDIVVEEYPYGSSNIVYTQNCAVGNYPQIASSNIVSGKMYRYYVRATTDCNTCNSAYSQSNYFHIVPEIFPSPSVNVCNGTGIILSTPTISVPSGATVSYQWYRGLNSNSTLISGQTGNTCYVTQSGYYYVKAVFTGSSVCGGTLISEQSLYTYVSIATTPSAPVLSSNAPICEGNTLTLSTPYINGNLYFWTGPNGFTSNNTSITIQTVTIANAGTYSCYVTNQGCQSPVATINVTINPAPSASFTYNAAGNTFTFTNTSTNATSYNWTFGDSQTSTQTSPTHTYASNNNYSVCLTTNRSGCNSASNCQLISLGSGSSGSTVSTFAKLFKDTTSTHNYWNVYDIVQSPVDSGFICIGQYQNSANNNFNGVNYFKLDKNGTLLWSRVMPEYSSAYGYKTIKSQQGYLLSMNYNGSVIMEIDEMGNKLWGKKIEHNVLDTISNTSYQFGLGPFIRSRNNGYFGFTPYYYTHYFDNWGTPTSTEIRSGIAYTKIDNSGNVLWQKQIRYNLYSHTNLYIRRSFEDNNGNIYLVGNIGDASVFPPYNAYDALIVKLDSMGNHLWSKYYSSSSGIQDELLSVIVDSNSDIVISGFSQNNSSNTINGFISKINPNGNPILSKSLPTGFSGYLIPNNISPTYDIQIGGFGGGQLQGIANLTNSLTLNNQKVFKSYYFNTSLKTFDSKFIMGGQSVINGNPPDLRYNIIKEDYTSSLCIDTILTNVILTNLTISLNPLTIISSNLSLSVSNFSINPILSNLKDSNLCHQCNLTASIVPSGATTFCSGGNITLTANAGMISYLWSNGQTGQSISVSQTGNYSVAVTDNYSCPAISQNVSVTVNSLPYADAGIDQSVCNGSDVVIGTTQISGNTYNWSPSTNLNNAQIAMPTANPTSQTTYTVTVTNSFNCMSTDQTTISVNPLPSVTANATLNSICNGASVTLTGGGATTYTWTGGITNGVAFNPTSTNSYTVTGTDANNCQNIATTNITVNPLPTANFAASQTTGKCPFTVDFFDLSQATGNTSYLWTIYNGTGSPITTSTQNPTGILYNVAGSYLVKLTISDTCGTNTKILPNYITVSCADGIVNNGTNASISVYPNPTHSLLNVDFGTNITSKVNLSIFNTIGQKVYNSKLELGQSIISIPVVEWANGIYFIKVHMENQETNYKFIKE